MSNEEDDLLRRLWTSRIRVPIAPDRAEMTEEEAAYFEQHHRLPPETVHPSPAVPFETPSDLWHSAEPKQTDPTGEE